MTNNVSLNCFLCGRIVRNKENICLGKKGYSFDEHCWPLYRKFISIYGNGFVDALESVKL